MSVTEPGVSLRLLIIKALAIIVPISCLIQAVGLILFPSRRTGPFGDDLPARMIAFDDQALGFSIDYPESWKAFPTLPGNHGDKEVILPILVPGRSFPQVIVARTNRVHGDINEVSRWGESRLADLSGFNRIGTETMKTEGLESELLSYSYQTYSPLTGEITIQCLDLYTSGSEFGYAFSFCNDQEKWSRTEQVFRNMIESIHLQ